MRLGQVNLSEADLSGADLSGADLSGVQNLTQDQINGIRFRRDGPPRNLPGGLTLPEPYKP